MTTTNETMVYTLQAQSDLSAQATRYLAITFAGVVVPTATAAGASARVAGILQSAARSGDQATYVYQGITKCVAGFAVSTLGYPIMVGSLGYMFAANSGFSHVGRALETAASGDLFQAVVDFTTLPLWSGV